MNKYLELHGISKYFGNFKANDCIDLLVEKGTIHAIIGENGAGKSTLMNILSGIYQPDEGEIFIEGKKVLFNNPVDAGKAGVGMVYQEFMLFPELTVLDNIMLGVEKKNRFGLIDKKKTQIAIQDICNTYHFNIPLNSIISELPVSVMQQVEIVKILYRGANILIFDEPTSVLTPQGVEGLFEAFRFLIKMGKTIIFISHKLKEVLEIADYITVMKDGQVSGNTKPKETSENDLARMMVGREVMLKAKKISRLPTEEILTVKDLYSNDDHGKSKVRGVNLTIRAGEILGIAGIAGSGQDELVETIFGLRNTSSGEILFCGQNITNLSSRERRCLGIGYVPQNRIRDAINKNASIWENSIMGYHIAHGFKSNWLIDKRASFDFSNRIVEDFSVKASSVENVISSLSGGNIQKVIVGREFLQENRLLIIEDPTRGIDVGAIEFIWKKIEELACQGVGILLVSHELNEIMEVSDRIMVMYNGFLVNGGLHGELTEEQIGLLMTTGALNE